MDDFGKVLKRTDPSLFFTMNDVEDRRLGDLVRGWSGKVNINIFLAKANIAIAGIPDDTGVKKIDGRTGARKAPAKVRQEFYRLTYGCTRQIDPLNIVDIGDLDIEGDQDKNEENCIKVVSNVLKKDIIPIVIGGSHEYTYATAKSLVLAEDKKKIGVINIDSHLDVRNLKNGITSGTSFYRLLKEKIIDGKNIVQFGIQYHHNSLENYEFAKNNNSRILFLDDIEENPKKHFADALKELSADCDHILVSFDIDACRIMDAPGASASNSDGLTARDMKHIAYIAGKNSKVRIIDLMEINPKLDIDNRTSKLGAMIMHYFLKGVCERSEDCKECKTDSRSEASDVRREKAETKAEKAEAKAEKMESASEKKEAKQDKADKKEEKIEDAK